MKRTANPAVHCTRLVSKRWDHSCVSRKPAPVIAIATTSTPPQIRMSFRFRSASGPALFTKMCGPTSAKVPKQIQNKKGYKPVGIFIMANAANDHHQRCEPAAYNLRIVTELNGWLVSAAWYCWTTVCGAVGLRPPPLLAVPAMLSSRARELAEV